jgi:signal transduction histidine kinase
MSVPASKEQAIAETRLLRAIITLFGIMAVVYFGVSLQTIVQEAPLLHAWWTPMAVGLVFAGPAVIAAMCRWLNRDVLRVLLGGYAIVFTLTVVSFDLALVSSPLPATSSPWVLGITALGTVPAALAWRPAFAWAYFFPNVLLMGPARDIANGHGNVVIALQDGLFAPAFTAIFTALAIMSMRNARAVDRAAANAREVAARASSVEARLRERARLDALVHDEVMSTLYYATVGTPELDAAVARQARKALQELRAIGTSEQAAVSIHEFVNRLRSAAVAQSPRVTYSVEGVRDRPVPGDVASAFVEAAGEAVRNALAYASGDGTPVAVDVELVVDEGMIVVTITDRGVGFHPRTVPPHRLGIRVSIEGRMAIVPGGSATVQSRPRHGTVVTLRWSE